MLNFSRLWPCSQYLTKLEGFQGTNTLSFFASPSDTLLQDKPEGLSLKGFFGISHLSYFAAAYLMERQNS
jgi:hypothetical protein